MFVRNIVLRVGERVPSFMEPPLEMMTSTSCNPPGQGKLLVNTGSTPIIVRTVLHSERLPYFIETP